MINDNKLKNLFWDCVSRPHKKEAEIFSHENISNFRIKNFNLRFIELLQSPDCFRILKQSLELGGDKYYMTTLLTRVLLKRRDMGIYNELFERVI